MIRHLGSREFSRLRIGIGHPGSADQVVDYVLRKPSKPDAEYIQDAIDAARRELPGIVRWGVRPGNESITQWRVTARWDFVVALSACPMSANQPCSTL